LDTGFDDNGPMPAAAAAVAVTRHVTASPETVWSLVTDLPRMGEWSPENNGGSWVGGVHSAAVGAKFKGNNSAGTKRWTTTATVVEMSAPRQFAFDVSVAGLSVARWAYTIEPDGDGCTVTETWTDRRGRLAAFLGGMATGVKDRGAHNRAGMERTLEALAVTAAG
jgi:uncharacterized protein YndB with AHSA1/START domain